MSYLGTGNTLAIPLALAAASELLVLLGLLAVLIALVRREGTRSLIALGACLAASLPGVALVAAWIAGVMVFLRVGS